MFSKLPVPTLKWSGDNLRYMLAMFPVVGVVVGFLPGPGFGSAIY
jgi:cobalamin synthase